ANFFARREFMQALRLSTELALWTAVLSTLAGTLAAIALVRGRFRGRDAVNAFVTSPLLLPQILTGVALLQFFTLVRLHQTYWALLIGHVVVTTPYVVRTVSATLTHSDLALAEIESLAIGAWILGTGGGGSPYLALLNMRRLYRAGTVVQLMDPMDLADDALVAIVSNMGAPLVGQERLTDPRTIERAVRMMEEYLGRRFTAVMSLEIGGGNSIQPFMAAALLGLPVVDGDCMGRAFPEAQMTSFAIHDLPMYPLTLADVRDNAVIVARAESWKWMERLSRTACVAVGS